MGALLRAAFVASCLRGAFPPVDLRAVCLVRAIVALLVLLFYFCICSSRLYNEGVNTTQYFRNTVCDAECAGSVAQSQ